MIGLLIGSLTVLISSQIFRSFITNDNHLAVIGNLIGAALVTWYGIWFAGKAQGQKSSAIPVFFIAGLIGFFLVRRVIEDRFGFSSGIQSDNVITFALSGGIVCALAGGFFEAITQSE